MPKTLISYPRMSYGFSFILYLNEHFYSPIYDLCSSCECRWNEQLLGAFWEQRVEVQRAGSNVATSQRHDVTTSRRWVNKNGSQQASQRRDVSAISASPSLKAKKGPEFEASGYVRTRARKAESSEGNQ